MKSKKKIIIIAAVIAAVGLAAFIGVKTVNGASSQMKTVSATPLAKMDLANTVSVTGTVKSEDAVNVYSTLAYQVKRVDVEVGDTVTEGRVLCELDTESLLSQIEQQTAALNNGQTKAQRNVVLAQYNYEVEKFNQQENYDAQLLNAQLAVDNAEKGVESAELRLRSANASLSSARRTLKDFRDTSGYNSDTYSLENEQLTQAVTQGQITVEQAESALADAKKAVEDAKAALRATTIQKQEALNNAQYQVETARINANMEDQWMVIDELKKNLDKAVIKAPISGTVTAVLATEGGSGQGLLFVIEDTNALRVDTKIEEYDIASVELGQTTKIKSDGTGDDEYLGKVSKIAPTAVKALNGETVETTDVQFVTEIGVTSKPTRLKIGMNARLEIVTQEKKDVFAVSYDAVVDNANGGQSVFVARQRDTAALDGAKDNKAQGPSFTVKEIAVTTGLETDFYIEIMSDELHEGDLIVGNPAALADGEEVAIADAMGAAGGPRNNGPGGPGGGMGVRVGG